MNDLKFAFRQLLKNPGFTAVAVLTLALGIGANTAVFSIVNAILLRPLPVKDAAELRAICYRNQDGSLTFPNVSFPFYRMYRDESRSFSEFIGYAPISVAVREGEKRIHVRGQLVSGNYFEALGVRPILGRSFLPAEDEVPGRDPVAVLSHDYWQQRFGGDTNLIGQTLRVNDQTLTIVGIAPEGFRGLHSFVSADFWAPTAMEQALGAHTVYRMVGRLARGVTREHAIAELDSITQRIAEAYGRNAPPGYERYGLMSADQHTTLLPAAVGSWGPERGGRDKVTKVAAMFMGAVALVLLISCANTANLLLVRALKRRKEVAIRLALGASRGRLVRQLLTESLILGSLGATLGMLFAKWGTDALLVLRTGMFKSVPIDASPDVRVLAFTLGLALFTGLVFGLLPALQSLQFDLHPTLKDDASSGTMQRGRFGLRNLLVVLELSVCLVLLLGAGLCLRSFAKLAAIDPGFDAANVLSASIALDGEKYSAEAALIFVDQILERTAALPGVRAVTVSDELLPLSGSYASMSLNQLDGYEQRPGEAISYGYSDVGPNYFRMLGIPLAQGRQFDKGDRLGSAPVAIVNESFARRYWPAQNPIGQRVSDAEVVGVVRDSRIQQVSTEPAPHVYRAKLQGDGRYFSLLVKTEGGPTLLVPQLRRELQALDKSLEPSRIDTLENIWSASLGGQRLLMTVLAVFAGVAMALATIGLYGVMAYSVAQRVREIGIRIALGARERDALALVLSQGMRLALSGLFIGLIAALVVTRVLRSLLYGVSSTDPLTFVGVSLILLLVALFASWLPARRAARVDPMEALRCE